MKNINCNDCLLKKQCSNGGHCFIDNCIENKNIYPLLSVLKKNTERSNDLIMKRHSYQSQYVNYDNTYTLDKYYVNMINECLKDIRKGNVSYVYNIHQLQDVLRYEPNINCKMLDDVLYISL